MVSRRKEHTFQPAWRWDRAWSRGLWEQESWSPGWRLKGVWVQRGPTGAERGPE